MREQRVAIKLSDGRVFLAILYKENPTLRQAPCGVVRSWGFSTEFSVQVLKRRKKNRFSNDTMWFAESLFWPGSCAFKIYSDIFKEDPRAVSKIKGQLVGKAQVWVKQTLERPCIHVLFSSLVQRLCVWATLLMYPDVHSLSFANLGHGRRWEIL